jgi:hypothetical protein
VIRFWFGPDAGSGSAAGNEVTNSPHSPSAHVLTEITDQLGGVARVQADRGLAGTAMHMKPVAKRRHERGLVGAITANLADTANAALA